VFDHNSNLLLIFNSLFFVLKVSKFQNKFMKSSLLQKYEPKLVIIYRAEIPTIFGSYFGRNDDFINSF
jgi:hypothetical protein